MTNSDISAGSAPYPKKKKASPTRPKLTAIGAEHAAERRAKQAASLKANLLRRKGQIAAKAES